ncbi:bifunctional DNA primase/helicase [Verminephrobacter aporrectodeae subsp. tuberculatae]|uniref:toprim domain-containing protein n=1 Tax=Verminephrobacter aporrectodeae TaxID=1110389 RepID=UPI00224302C4|nr:toprim domain-containing protein [Verminephrobacter aporrectodeae]MCW8199274.1 bifunctional DNA primase/helicase [Verminephrobacter aporrectodeae subsp. tuberculatae]MCW8207655.1 bifunctional DNA primase/helicase [Verminephrobacter aporrectodeae subsp. tuberculatae]
MADLIGDITAALLAEFGFKPAGKYLQKGLCPHCKDKSRSLWTWADKPYVVLCERKNNCGYEGSVKDLYPDLFNSWTERYQLPEQAKPVEQRNPNAAAEAYLQQARGFKLALVKGLFTQETYFDQKADNGRGVGTATVRFQVANTWWERLIDRPWRFGKKKANFKYGGAYQGCWWSMPSLSFASPDPAAPADAPKPPIELWLVEGIFDAIALAHHGVVAVALLSCNNYPEKALAGVREQIRHQGGLVAEPTLIWALDSDKAGREYTLKYVARARADGWTCEAAQIPQRGRRKQDWNDMHERGELAQEHLDEYRYHGALLIAGTALEKALLMYQHDGRPDFEVTHHHRLYWFRLDLERYAKARDHINELIAEGKREAVPDDAQAADALRECVALQPIANCDPQALYYQRNEVTGEAWYYFRVAFPHGEEVKGTFTAGQLTTAVEFKKQLLHMAAGAIFSGSSGQLERMMQRQLERIKVVQTVDYIGYSATHKAYILGKVAVRNGQLHETNAEDYFDFDKLAIKSLQKSIGLGINTRTEEYERGWIGHLWNAFGAKGYIALAYWVGSLFAEQVRAEQMSWPFLEIVGEPGSGKTTLIQFLWKLFGRDYEGFDPSKSTSAGRLRTFTQVSNLPIVLIESDRETKNGNQAHVKSFDWDELKDAYNGNNIRTTGVKTGGNETYDPPFRASIVISQNNPVQASQAIMERICHMTFDTRGFTPASYESARALEKVEINQVSGFILASLKHEAEVLKDLVDKTEQHTQFILEQEGVHKPRIAKNHAQILTVAEAMRRLVPITQNQFHQVREQLVTMAQERQRAINADHPLVQEFWEAFDFLNGTPLHTPHGPKDVVRLDHSRDPRQIAVNLNEFVEMASQHRQQVPMLTDLKKVLRTSKTRRFVDVKGVNSAIRLKKDDSTGQETGRTVHCWVFEFPTKPTRKT